MPEPGVDPLIESRRPYFQADDVTIWHGDCRDVLPKLGIADLLITDPPYGVDYVSGHNNRHHGNPSIFGDDGSLDVMAALRLALDRLRRNRHFYVFGPYDLSLLTLSSTTELIWDKTRTGMGDLELPWSPSHERIAFGVWHPAPSMANGGRLTTRLRRGSVLAVPPDNKGQGARYHPTAKPVLLLRQLIESSSTIGEMVLDPFMGSGSTLVAARVEGRRAVGIEIEERYCEVAARRLAQGVLDLGEYANA
jgi:DNA modification methylase